jgi:hypothetical protein
MVINSMDNNERGMPGMRHGCPECDGANVRRSSTPAAERTWRNDFYSRYRCRDCLHEFWVVRRKTYMGGAVLIAAIVLAIIVAFSIEKMFNPLNGDGFSEHIDRIRNLT